MIPSLTFLSIDARPGEKRGPDDEDAPKRDAYGESENSDSSDEHSVSEEPTPEEQAQLEKWNRIQNSNTLGMHGINGISIHATVSHVFFDFDGVIVDYMANFVITNDRRDFVRAVGGTHRLDELYNMFAAIRHRGGTSVIVSLNSSSIIVDAFAQHDLLQWFQSDDESDADEARWTQIYGQEELSAFARFDKNINNIYDPTTKQRFIADLLTVPVDEGGLGFRGKDLATIAPRMLIVEDSSANLAPFAGSLKFQTHHVFAGERRSGLRLKEMEGIALSINSS